VATAVHGDVVKVAHTSCADNARKLSGIFPPVRKRWQTELCMMHNGPVLSSSLLLSHLISSGSRKMGRHHKQQMFWSCCMTLSAQK
jgi:hypothetical protein